MFGLILFFIFVIVILAGAYYAYTIAFYAPPRQDENITTDMKGEQYEKYAPRVQSVMDRMLEIPFETVTITSPDGLKLYGRYYHTQDSAPIQIMFHGYRSAAQRDGCGGHSLARKMGLNILMVDQRAHGKSEGNIISFGIKEREDCLAWCKYVSERFGEDVPIVLTGLSMGAATVLMASNLELPGAVAGIIADSPYASPRSIICKVCKDMHLPAWLAYPFVKLGAALYGQFSIDVISAEDAVKSANVPILLLHGEDDRFVPCEMSALIRDSCASTCTLYTFPGAAHGLCYMTDPQRYERIIKEFLLTLPTIKTHFDGFHSV
jgi:fermentation-respiration switch protein FrsA (DUF1100 family)